MRSSTRSSRSGSTISICRRRRRGYGKRSRVRGRTRQRIDPTRPRRRYVECRSCGKRETASEPALGSADAELKGSIARRAASSPREPSQPARCYPKRKRVGLFEKVAERLERRHRLQVDRNLFAATVRRLAVNASMLRPGRRAVTLVAPTSLRRGARLNSDNGRLHCFCHRLRVIVTPPPVLHPSWRPSFSPPP